MEEVSRVAARRKRKPTDYAVDFQEVIVKLGRPAPGSLLFSQDEIDKIRNRAYGIDVLLQRRIRKIPAAWEVA